MNVFVVIPTIRSLDFLSAWKEEFEGCHLIIVEDHPVRQISTPTKGFLSVSHYTWENIAKDFGKDGWIFPRQNAGIRSYGFWKALQKDADIIITLDDDCYPTERGFVKKHVDNLSSAAPSQWFPTFPHPSYMYTRGFPYKIRNKHRVGISHGLWSNKMDMDAKTQLSIGEVNVAAYPPLRQFVPFGYFFPMSSMNLAFTREVAPLMYFPLMGKDPNGKGWGYDRYDDIWAGVLAKKVLDHLGIAVVNGSPFVEHKKASDVQSNLIKEKRGMSTNESLWRSIEKVALTHKGVVGAQRELVQNTIFPEDTYFSQLRKSILIWNRLFA